MHIDQSANDNSLSRNVVRPFVLEESGIGGRFVRMDSVVNTLIRGHEYPDSVAKMLGELAVLVTMIGATLKMEGGLTLQAQGNGPVELIVVKYRSDGNLRGFVGIKKDLSKEEEKLLKSKNPDLQSVLGSSHLLLTLENKHSGQFYQGMVELVGDTLAECVENYFEKSVQRRSKITVKMDRIHAGKKRRSWHAAGVMLQRTPKEGGYNGSHLPGDGEDEEWDTACILLDTMAEDELMNPEIGIEEVLYRLFHEEGVRIYEPAKVNAKCGCSRGRMHDLLKNIPKEEIAGLKNEAGFIEVSCQFCGRVEEFVEKEI